MNNLEKNERVKPEKVKKTYAFHPEVAQLIETHKYEHRGREIDFVSQAIRNYCAEIDGEKSLDVLCRHIDRLVDAKIENQSSRWSHILFKIAVELGILNHMLAAGYVDLTEEEMRYIRNQCTNNVRKSRGFILFENALAEERRLSAEE